MDQDRLRRRARAFLAVLASACWLTGLSGTFVLDDATAIVENPRIRTLWPPDVPLGAPPRTSLSGRPLASLSFALTHAVGGLDPVPHLLGNLAIHILAGLVLFGLVRRTLEGSPRIPPDLRGNAVWAALFASAAWIVHPLQTESVTYIVQRTESLAGLFYLATLYGLARAAFDPSGRGWGRAAPVFCALGALTKETLVTAPVVALLYDRAFAAGTFREALARRGRLHALLFSSWAILAELLLGGHQTFGAASAARTVSPLETLCVQARSIVHYARLTLWPGPLCLDYGWPLRLPLSGAWPHLLAVGALLAAALHAAWRNTPAGFLLLSFFALLAPTSSVIPMGDAVFEHRMYLPLAPLAAGASCALFLHGARWTGTTRRRAVLPGLAAVACLAALTARRNADYRDKAILYAGSIRVSPGNPRAHANLGKTWAQRQDARRAFAEHRAALASDPDHAKAVGSMGALLAKLGNYEPAVAHLRRALELDPEDPDMRAALADVHAYRGHFSEAVAEYRRVLERAPDHLASLANAAWLLATGPGIPDADPAEAVALAERAMRLSARPRPEILDAYAAALAAAGRFDEAARAAERGIEAARARKDGPLAGQIGERLALYRAGRPFRQPPVAPAGTTGE